MKYIQGKVLASAIMCSFVVTRLHCVYYCTVGPPECSVTVDATTVTDTSITVRWMWTNCDGAEPSNISLTLFPPAQDPIIIANQRGDITGLEPNTTYSIVANFSDACGNILVETVETTLPHTGECSVVLVVDLYLS